MSAFVKTETQISDINVLKEALKAKGFTEDKIETHEEAQNLYGIGGSRREQTAELIIRRQHVGSASNDIGFKRTEKGNFEAIISQYDKATKYGNAWLNDLKKTYTELKVKQTMKKLGATQLSQTQIQKNGKPVSRIQFSVKG